MTEQRLFGAINVISNKKGEVLLYVDKPKLEMSSGVEHDTWWTSDASVLNFPSGGRQGFETARQTGERELQEETEEDLTDLIGPLKGNVFLPKRNRHNTGQPFVKQRYPSIVAQLETEDGIPQRINQIGATSLQIDYDRFSTQSKNILGLRVENKLAFWVRLKDIYEGLMDGDPRNTEFQGLRTRPQLFTTALIWHLEQVGTDPKLIKYTITNGNRELIHKVKKEANTLSVPIRNGSFQENGQISTVLSKNDLRYISRK